MKTRQDHDMTNCLDVVNAENNIKLHDRLDYVLIMMKTR